MAQLTSIDPAGELAQTVGETRRGGSPPASLALQSAGHLRVALAGAAATIRWSWGSPAHERLERDYTIALSQTHQAGLARAMARRHVRTRAMCDAMLWRHNLWRCAEFPNESILADGLKKPGGVIIATLHSPCIWLGGATLTATFGHKVKWVAGKWLGEQGQLEPGARALASTGSELVMVGDAYHELGRSLAEGNAVGLLVDVPGRTPVRFFEKPCSVNSGFARLAMHTGASILPSLASWHRGRPTLLCSPLIEASPSISVDDLCRRVFRALDDLVLPRPHVWSPGASKMLWGAGTSAANLPTP